MSFVTSVGKPKSLCTLHASRFCTENDSDNRMSNHHTIATQEQAQLAFEMIQTFFRPLGEAGLAKNEKSENRATYQQAKEAKATLYFIQFFLRFSSSLFSSVTFSRSREQGSSLIHLEGNKGLVFSSALPGKTRLDPELKQRITIIKRIKSEIVNTTTISFNELNKTQINDSGTIDLENQNNEDFTLYSHFWNSDITCARLSNELDPGKLEELDIELIKIREDGVVQEEPSSRERKESMEAPTHHMKFTAPEMTVQIPATAPTGLPPKFGVPVFPPRPAAPKATTPASPPTPATQLPSNLTGYDTVDLNANGTPQQKALKKLSASGPLTDEDINELLKSDDDDKVSVQESTTSLPMPPKVPLKNSNIPTSNGKAHTSHTEDDVGSVQGSTASLPVSSGVKKLNIVKPVQDTPLSPQTKRRNARHATTQRLLQTQKGGARSRTLPPPTKSKSALPKRDLTPLPPLIARDNVPPSKPLPNFMRPTQSSKPKSKNS